MYRKALSCPPPPKKKCRLNRHIGVCKDFLESWSKLILPHSGFTLAEVLITLGIIGVVAAITMPTLIANHKKQVAITQLKKAYSEMSQAIKLSEIDNSETKSWNYKLNAKDFYEIYLKNYLKSTKEVKYNTYNVKYTNLNNSACSESWCTDANGYYIMLANGTIIGVCNYINGSDPHYKSIIIDINGKKGPNKIGIDYFIYTIQERGFLPYGIGFYNLGENAFGNNPDRNKIAASSGRGCSSKGTGVFCSALILHDNWQIKYNYK